MLGADWEGLLKTNILKMWQFSALRRNWQKIKSIVEIQWLYFGFLRTMYPHSYKSLVLI